MAVQASPPTWTNLKIGDCISLYSQGGRGYLQSEGFTDRRLFVDALEDSHDCPEDFGGCVFRICPKNQYRQEKKLRKWMKSKGLLEGRTFSLELARSGDTKNLDPEDRKMMERLVDSFETEIRLNEAEYGRLCGTEVRYGDTIQLLHLKSNKFVIMKKSEVSELETNFLRIHLDETGSESTWFKISPRYRAVEEGESVRMETAVSLIYAKTGVESLHCSEALFDEGHPLEGKHEVNGSGDGDKGWRVMPYAEYSDTRNKYLFGGDVVRLYQKEEEVWLSTAPKVAQFESDVFGKPSHTMKSQSTNTLWIVERERRNVGGVLTFSDHVRLRHFGTGATLTLAGAPVEVERRDPDHVYATVHVEDNVIVRKEPEAGQDLWRFESLFKVADPSSHKVAVAGSIRLQHAATEQWMHVLDNMEEDMNMDEEGGMVGHGKKKKLQSVVASSYNWAEDSFIVVSVSESEVRDVAHIQSLLPVCEKFLAKHKDAPDLRITNEELRAVMDTLQQFILLCTESDDYNPLTREGTPYTSRQNALRELGVVDNVIDLLQLPDRKRGVFEEGIVTVYKERERSQKLFYDVLLHAYRLLKQVSKENTKTALHLAKHIDFMQAQMGYKLKAADTLMEIVKDNEKLLVIIDPRQILFFTELIKTAGRLARYMYFLVALLSCKGNAIARNQAIVLKEYVSVDHSDLMKVTVENGKVIVTEEPHADPKAVKWVLLEKFVGLKKTDPEKYGYFLKTMEMYASLARERNADAIKVLREQFVSYDVVEKVLSSGIYGPDIKRVFVDIAVNVFIDSDPQHPFRPVEYAIIYDQLTSEGEAASRESFDPQYQFRSFIGMKRFVAVVLTTHPKQRASDEDTNGLIVSTLQMLLKLMQFGFYNDMEENTMIGTLLLDIINGTDDRADAGIDPTAVDASRGRFLATEKNRPIHQAKLVALEVLLFLSDMVLGTRMRKVLYEFKTYLPSKESSTSVVTFTPELAHSLEKKCLNYLKYCASLESVAPVLIDLMSYESPPLVTRALQMLSRVANQSEELTDTVREAHIIVEPRIVNSYRVANVRLARLRQLIKPSMSSQEESEAVDILEYFMRLCTLDGQLPDNKWDGKVPSKMNVPGQDFLRALRIVDDAIHILNLPFSNKLPEEKGRREIFLRCYRLLLFYAKKNPKNQEELVPHLDLFLDQMGVKLKAADTINAIFSGNRYLCASLEPRIIKHFITLVATRGKFPRYLKFLETIVTVNDSPIKRNQNIIMSLLVAQKTRVMDLYNFDEGRQQRRELIASGEHLKDGESPLMYHVALVELLSFLADGQNYVTESVCQTLIPMDELKEHLSDDVPAFVKLPFSRFLKEVYFLVERPLPSLLRSQAAHAIVHNYGKDLSRFASEGLMMDPAEQKAFAQYLTLHMPSSIGRYIANCVRQESKEKIKTRPTTLIEAGRAVIDGIQAVAASGLIEDESAAKELKQLRFTLIESGYEGSVGSEEQYTGFKNTKLLTTATVDSADETTEGRRLMEFKSDLCDMLEEEWKTGNLHRTLAQVFESSDDNEIYLKRLLLQVRNPQFTDEAIKINILKMMQELIYAGVDPEEDGAELSEKAIENQIRMSRLGALELVLDLVGEPDTPPEILRESIKLGIALLFEGNETVQEDLYELFKSRQESRFFIEVKSLLRRGQGQIKEIKKWLKRIEDNDQDAYNEAPYKQSCVAELLRFLQLFAEGHNGKMQRYLQNQEHSPLSVDIVAEIVEYVNAAEKSINCASIGTLLQAFDTLTELVQGPCRETQRSIVDQKCCDSISRIFQLPLDHRSNPKGVARVLPEEYESWEELVVELRSKMLTTLLGLLESTESSYIPHRMLESLNISFMANNLSDLYTSYLAAVEGEGLDSGKIDEKSADSMLETCYSYYILFLSLYPYSKTSHARGAENLRAIIEDRKIVDEEALDFLSKGTGRIEILRNNKLFKYYFPIPAICKQINPQDKEKLLWEVNRDNPSQKLADFFEKTGDLYFGMRHEKRVSQSRFFRFLAKTSFLREKIGLLLAFLINIIILAAFGYADPSNDKAPFPTNDMDVDIPLGGPYYMSSLATGFLYVGTLVCSSVDTQSCAADVLVSLYLCEF